MLKLGFLLLIIDQIFSYIYRVEYYAPLLRFRPQPLFLVLALILIFVIRKKLLTEKKYRIAFNLLTFGVLSNLLSLLFRGVITDYINLIVWQTNIADFLIVLPLIYLGIQILGESKEKTAD